MIQTLINPLINYFLHVCQYTSLENAQNFTSQNLTWNVREVFENVPQLGRKGEKIKFAALYVEKSRR